MTLIERRRAVIEAVLDGLGEAKCPDCGDRLWWRWRSAGDSVKTSCDTCRIDEDVKMCGKYRERRNDASKLPKLNVPYQPTKDVLDEQGC